jgi:hypothetical protein
MSDPGIVLWLGLLALLGYYVLIKHRQTVQSQWEPPDSTEWIGKAIDVSGIIPRVKDVRRNHLAARQPPQGWCFRRALLELARQAVARSAYFHDRVPGEHAPTDTV